MPRANPHASFEVATKHLFRHLHEPDALRDNPLTSRFFEGAATPADAVRIADRVALEKVHGLVRMAAVRCRDRDTDTGKPERARRQYAIAIDGCLARNATHAIASKLGISTSQYYRERTDICTRIAEYIRDAGTPLAQAVTERFDDFRYALVHAAGLAELGEVDRAIEEYARLARCSDSAAQKIEALCENALAYLRLDTASLDVERTLGETERLLEQATIRSPRARATAQAHVAFARGMATWPVDPRAALASFSHALANLERLSLDPLDPATTLYIRVLFEYGEALTTFQNLRGSVETLAKASSILAACHDRSSALTLKIEITLQIFRNSLLVDPYGWEPLQARLQTMLELERRARATGSVDLNLRALNAIAQLQARSGDSAAALRAVRSALALANFHPTRELFSELTSRMARTLMYTPLWHEVPNVLRAAGAPATIAVAGTHKTLEAEYAIRRGMYGNVRTMISASEIARRPFNAMLAAQAANALGHQREALELIEPALPAIERSGIALTIGRAYRIASQITNDRHYGRKADEIERALSA